MDLAGAVGGVSSGPLRFLYAWILPSAVVAGIYFTVVAPRAWSTDLLQSSNTGSVLVIGSAVLLATLTVSAAVGLLSLPIYRVLEGYTIPRWLSRRLRRRQMVRWRRLQVMTRRGRPERRASAEEQLERYPER